MDAEQRMSPEQREVVQRERAARARANRLEMENRQLKAQMAQQAQPQRTRGEEYLLSQLNSMMPQAIQRMAKRGVEWVDTSLTRRIFEQNWATMLQTLDGRDLTTEFVENVLMSVVQDVAKIAKAGHIQQARPSAAASQLPPVSGLQGPTQPAARRHKRERIGSMSTMVGNR
jgi:alanyl-tRNA synthetase